MDGAAGWLSAFNSHLLYVTTVAVFSIADITSLSSPYRLGPPFVCGKWDCPGWAGSPVRAEWLEGALEAAQDMKYDTGAGVTGWKIQKPPGFSPAEVWLPQSKVQMPHWRLFSGGVGFTSQMVGIIRNEEGTLRWTRIPKHSHQSCQLWGDITDSFLHF